MIINTAANALVEKYLNRNTIGLIREPLEIDFTAGPRVLTKVEKNAISDYIRNYKIKEAGKKNHTCSANTAFES